MRHSWKTHFNLVALATDLKMPSPIVPFHKPFSVMLYTMLCTIRYYMNSDFSLQV